MTRVLVAGGGGFLGSHLCERLLQEPHLTKVVCLDNWWTGRKANIQHLRNDARFAIIDHDIREPLALDVDWIFNLACPASPPHYQADPIGTTLTCVVGTRNLLELARQRGARYVQASTSEIYGDPEQHPQTEAYLGNVNPIGPRACYDEGKRCAESLVSDYRRQHGVDARIARIFNTYGPRMDRQDGRVVSNFILQALAGEPVTVFGDGSQTRSFCYVSDLIDGLLRLMQASEAPEPINLGNPAEFTVGDLAEIVTAMVGSTSPVVYRPLPTDDPRRRRPDISRATQQLDWQPGIALDEGLERTIDYFRAQLAHQQPTPAAPALAS